VSSDSRLPDDEPIEVEDGDAPDDIYCYEECCDRRVRYSCKPDSFGDHRWTWLHTGAGRNGTQQPIDCDTMP